jgi:hypothetical protein
MRLEDFDFIGITESYAASLDVFRRMHGIQDGVREERKNANPAKEGARYEIPAALRQYVLDHNRKDLEIYRRAVAINQTLQSRYGVEP